MIQGGDFVKVKATCKHLHICCISLGSLTECCFQLLIRQNTQVIVICSGTNILRIPQFALHLSDSYSQMSHIVYYALRICMVTYWALPMRAG